MKIVYCSEFSLKILKSSTIHINPHKKTKEIKSPEENWKSAKRKKKPIKLKKIYSLRV